MGDSPAGRDSARVTIGTLDQSNGHGSQDGAGGIGRRTLLASVASMAATTGLAGCSLWNGTPDDVSPMDLLPESFGEFDDPVSVSQGPGSALADDVTVPGGYATRLWQADDAIALAVVGDWERTEDARGFFDRVTDRLPAGTVERPDVGDRARLVTERADDAAATTRLLLVGVGPLNAIAVAGGFDADRDVPAEEVVGLGERIVANARETGAANRVRPPDASRLRADPVAASLAPVSGPVAGLADRVAGIASSIDSTRSVDAASNTSGTIDISLTTDAGAEVGTATVEYEFTTVGQCDDPCETDGERVACDRVKTTVTLTELSLAEGVDDGDGFPRGDGDVFVVGSTTVYYTCGGATEPKKAAKIPTAELMDLAAGQTKSANYELASVEGCQCPSENPRIDQKVLVRDNDGGDILDVVVAILGFLLASDLLEGQKRVDARRARKAAKGARKKFWPQGKSDKKGLFEKFREEHRGDDLGTGSGSSQSSN